MYKPTETFKFIEWSDAIILAGMSEHVCNPVICVNLPLGGEEMLFHYSFSSNLFLHFSYHLAGNRLPKHFWPTHYLVGIEHHLKKFIVYSLHLSMMQSIAPLNIDKYLRNIYPWLDKNFNSSSSCLRDRFKIIANENNQKEMQKRFWKNIHILLDPNNSEKMLFKYDLKNLISMPVDEILQNFQKDSKLTTQEKKSLNEIGKLYKFYQKDAQYLGEFGSLILKHTERPDISAEIDRIKKEMEKKYHIQFKDLPLTFGFYLMTKALGAAEFNEEIKRILTEEADISSLFHNGEKNG